MPQERRVGLWAENLQQPGMAGGFIRSLAVACVNAAAVALMRQPLWVCVAGSIAPGLSSPTVSRPHHLLLQLACLSCTNRGVCDFRAAEYLLHARQYPSVVCVAQGGCGSQGFPTIPWYHSLVPGFVPGAVVAAACGPVLAKQRAQADMQLDGCVCVFMYVLAQRSLCVVGWCALCCRLVPCHRRFCVPRVGWGVRCSFGHRQDLRAILG